MQDAILEKSGSEEGSNNPPSYGVDALTLALGKPDRPGRVKVTGTGYKKAFGHRSSTVTSTASVDVDKLRAEITEELRAEFDARLEARMKELEATHEQQQEARAKEQEARLKEQLAAEVQRLLGNKPVTLVSPPVVEVCIRPYSLIICNNLMLNNLSMFPSESGLKKRV